MTRVSMAVVSAVLFCLALNVVSANARPAPEIGGPSPAVQISGSRFGNDFFCAVQQDSTVQCWGTNASGQLGEGSTGGQEASPVFVKVNTNGTSTNLANAIAVSVGGTHACALLSDGSVRCWGNNSNGQLGSGTPGISSTAVPVKV